MLYGGGLRVTELAGIPLVAARARDGFIRVVGKGQQGTFHAAVRRGAAALGDYLAVRERIPAERRESEKGGALSCSRSRSAEGLSHPPPPASDAEGRWR